jgi:hypothetical protein
MKEVETECHSFPTDIYEQNILNHPHTYRQNHNVFYSNSNIHIILLSIDTEYIIPKDDGQFYTSI